MTIPMLFITLLIFSSVIAQLTEKNSSKDATTMSIIKSTKFNSTIKPCCPCYRGTSSIPVKRLWNMKKHAESLYRLPDLVWPLEYKLSLKIDFNEFKNTAVGRLKGNVTIKVLIKNETDVIYLNTENNLKLFSVTVRNTDSLNDRNETKAVSFESYFMLRIDLKTNVTAGEHYLIELINFETSHRLFQESGIISRKYQNSQGEYEYMMATQFQPESARSVFPCFDEPRFKTTVQMNITTNAEYTILNNMPEINCQLSEKNNISYWKTCSFETSPVMPMYNLAFAIVNFEYLEKYDEKGRRFRIWTRKSQIEHAQFALNITIRAFDLFEKYFKIDFPLKKIDSLAIPNLKGFLGMEHYGLITYDEPVLIWNENFPLTYSKLLTVSIICHEVAHQWFGNFVTTMWWQNLWLNEGFATYFSNRMTEVMIKDNLHYSLEFLSISNHVRNLDDYISPLKSTISAPVAVFIDDKFGYLSYKKGSLVVNMIEKVLGTKVFDLAIHHYLDTNKYNSVIPMDLWNSLNKYSKFPVQNLIEDWINIICYPIVQVSAYQNNSINLTQQISVNLKSIRTRMAYNDSNTINWRIPLYITYGNNISQVGVIFDNLEEKSKNLELNTLNISDNWILINTNYSSFFSTDYDETMFDKLVNQMLKNHQVIPPMNRAQIIQDYYDISKKYHRTNLHKLLKLFTYARKECHPIPLTTVINLLDKLNGLFELRSFYSTWKRYLESILKPTFEKLVTDFENDFQNDNSMHIRLRQTVLNFACRLKFKHCFMITNKILERWHNNTLLETDFDLLHIAICKYIQQDDDEGTNWNSLYSNNQFSSWDYINVKYYAMGCTKVPWIIEKNIDIAYNILKKNRNRIKYPHVTDISIDNIPPDYLHGTTPISSLLILSFIYNTPNAIVLVTRFHYDGLSLINDFLYFPHHFPLPKSMVEYAVPTLSHYDLLLKFYSQRERLRNTILNIAKINIDWILNNSDLERKLNNLM